MRRRGGIVVMLVSAILALPSYAATKDSIQEKLDKEKQIYEKAVQSAKERLSKAYDRTIESYTKKGNLEKAMSIKEEKEVFLAEGFQSDEPLVETDDSEISNIAPSAKVQASSKYDKRYFAEHIADGIKGAHMTGEWATRREGKGAWIALSWKEFKTVHKIILYDRPNADDWFKKGIIQFSDKSTVKTGLLPNDGKACEVVLKKPKRTKWIKIVVTEAVGLSVGLSEVEVFGK